MKFRMGFVSNSSSSSFVAGFKTIPRSVEDIKKILFDPGQEYYYSPYGDGKWSVDEVAATVFEDMKGKMPLSLEEFFKATDDMADINYDAKKYKKKEKNINGDEYMGTDWDLVWKDQKILSKEQAEKFLAKNDDYYYFEFSYADEDGDYGSALEHGDLFKNVPCISISHH